MTGSALGRLLPAACMTFAAGLLIGYMGRGGGSPAQELSIDLAAYESAMAETLELSPGQQTDLHVLLLTYQRDRNEELLRLRFELEPELTSIDRRFNELIKTRILTADQRRRARVLLRPGLTDEEALAEDANAALPATEGSG